MKTIGLIADDHPSACLAAMIEEVKDTGMVVPYGELDSLQEQRLVFALDLDEIGEAPWLLEQIRKWYRSGERVLEGSVAIFLIRSESRLYTKEMAQRLVFLVNGLGAKIPGQPLIEAVADLENMRKWAQKLSVSRKEALRLRVSETVQRLLDYEPLGIKNPRLLVLHANTNEKTSNTHLLWNEVEKHLDIDYDVIHVEDGTVLDCRGCAYDTCFYYAKHNSCFYGGVMVQEILPAIEEADAVLWLLPNYNDSISAKLMAVINRLTVLYLKKPLPKKNLYAIVVSGNSGSDSVLRQLIGAMNVNKGFLLPPDFYLEMTASYPGEILESEELQSVSRAFARTINETSRII